MKNFSKYTKGAAMSFLIAGIMSMPVAAQTAEHDTSISGSADTSAHDWTAEQLVTSSVHEAWVLSGRNEDRFFDMVQTLAKMSAEKRGLTLPETQDAGMKAGAWIKKEAKRDPDQLLYAVVDKAVMHVGVKK